MMVTDEEIRRVILDVLQQDRDFSPHDIDVQVHQQQVTLSGTVDTYAHKRSAEHRVYGVRHIKRVVNRIEVHPPGRVDHPDESIARAAREALGRDAFIPGDQITISVAQGWVTLRGEVTYDFQKTDAERDVTYLDGVLGVKNFLTVKTAGEVVTSEQELEEPSP
jgi:osmotically-inducible protein OsmY